MTRRKVTRKVTPPKPETQAEVVEPTVQEPVLDKAVEPEPPKPETQAEVDDGDASETEDSDGPASSGPAPAKLQAISHCMGIPSGGFFPEGTDPNSEEIRPLIQMGAVKVVS